LPGSVAPATLRVLRAGEAPALFGWLGASLLTF